MRTEQQIKRKLNELILQKQSLEARLEAGNAQGAPAQIEQIDQLIGMLEWVLNEPTGSYHV